MLRGLEEMEEPPGREVEIRESNDWLKGAGEGGRGARAGVMEDSLCVWSLGEPLICVCVGVLG